MRVPVRLLCITPKTGRVHRYVDRKRVDKGEIVGALGELVAELRDFRLWGRLGPTGGTAA